MTDLSKRLRDASRPGSFYPQANASGPLKFAIDAEELNLLKKTAREAATALDALPQWKPISKAPRDGTWVLVYLTPDYFPDTDAGWLIHRAQWVLDRYHPSGGRWASQSGTAGYLGDPTHFMHLPPPPEDA